MNRVILWLAAFLGLTIASSAPALGQEDLQRVLDLRGQWKFMIGDRPGWSDPGFDDGAWPDIFVPSAWEDEGYPGYDGFAWYRWKGSLRSTGPESVYILDLGRVDDVDHAYVNGCRVGSAGSFPPRYQTAYHQWRRYEIPHSCLRQDGKLVVAVRVYDGELSGGMLEGSPGVYRKPLPAGTVLNLAGFWKFRRGDDAGWAQPSASDAEWTEVRVPNDADSNPWPHYDGFGWYRTSFIARREWGGESLALELGRIDDLDEVYLNGVRIGGIGPMPERPDMTGHISQQWTIVRRYPVPDGVLRAGRENVLAVRVYDHSLDGGMLGPYVVLRRSDAITAAEWRESQASSSSSGPAPSDGSWWSQFIRWLWGGPPPAE